jgi:hypothetical protein
MKSLGGQLLAVCVIVAALWALRFSRDAAAKEFISDRFLVQRVEGSAASSIFSSSLA